MASLNTTSCIEGRNRAIRIRPRGASNVIRVQNGVFRSFRTPPGRSEHVTPAREPHVEIAGERFICRWNPDAPVPAQPPAFFFHQMGTGRNGLENFLQSPPDLRRGRRRRVASKKSCAGQVHHVTPEWSRAWSSSVEVLIEALSAPNERLLTSHIHGAAPLGVSGFPVRIQVDE